MSTEPARPTPRGAAAAREAVEHAVHRFQQGEREAGFSSLHGRFYRPLMACYQELPYRELASAMGCPVNTVKTRMSHTRRKLRTLLPPQGGERWEAERAR